MTRPEQCIVGVMLISGERKWLMVQAHAGTRGYTLVDKSDDATRFSTRGESELTLKASGKASSSDVANIIWQSI